MAWDFETDPEFQAKLDWAEAFVRSEVEPLDMLFQGLEFTPPDKSLRRIVDPLKDQVRAQGLWATHLGPELGGQGHGQLKLSLLNEILGGSSWAPVIFGCQAPDTGQRRDHRSLRHRGPEGALSAPAPGGGDLLVLLDDRATGGLGPGSVRDPRDEGRRRVGPQRLEVLLVQRPDRGVPHRHGRHQPRGVRLRGHVHVPRPGRHPGRRDRPQRRTGRGGRGRRIPCPDPLRRRAPASRCSARRRGSGLRHRPDSPRRRPHPPRHAHDRDGPPGDRMPCASGRSAGRCRAAVWRTSSSSRATSPTPTPS